MTNYKRKKKTKTKTKTLDLILLIIGIYIALFIAVMTIIFCIYQSTPDTLIVAVLGSGGTECVLCALITMAKVKKENKTDTDTEAIEE